MREIVPMTASLRSGRDFLSSDAIPTVDLAPILYKALTMQIGPQIQGAWKYAIVTYVWMVWHFINMALFDDRNFPYSVIHTRIWAHMRELNSMHHGFSTAMDNTDVLDAFEIVPRLKNEPQQISVKWHKPQAGWVKCNTDASVFGAPGPLKGGGLFRDHNGN